MDRSRLIIIGVLMLVAGCTSSADEKGAHEHSGPIVARVNGEAIYVRDFVLNYELGFPHLRRGEDAREAYLQRVVDEKLLAIEGYRRGLDSDAAVQDRIEDLREELLVEQVFERYVNENVSVTEEEILEAMQKDRVSFKVRYIPAPTFDRAHALRAQAIRKGFDKALTDFIESQPDIPVQREDLESPYVTWRDVNPVLMAAIENVPVGGISPPVRYNGSYLIVQVVDVRREPVGPATHPEERSRYEQVVLQRKARTQARQFIGSMMKPLDVRVKPRAFVTLRNNLWRWYQDDPPQENLLRALEGAEASYGDSLRSILDEVLITSKEGDWSVRRFLQEYPIERYPLRHKRTEDFESDIYDAIGLTLRDHSFTRRAENEGLDEASEYAHELGLWSDKWVFRAFVEQIDREGGSVIDTVRTLRSRYPVEIRHEVLDSLELSGPESAGLTVLKGHTSRPAFPVADAAW